MRRGPIKYGIGLLVIGVAGYAIVAGVQSYRNRARAWRLADGTEVYFRGGTTVTPAAGFPRPRAVNVNGDLFVTAPDLPVPLTIHTRLLNLTLSAGAAVRITAFAQETGAQAEVVRGRVIARKAYASRDSVPDTLAPGEMVMINQTIDLMEKEKDTPETTQSWSEALINAAGAPVTRP